MEVFCLGILVFLSKISGLRRSRSSSWRLRLPSSGVCNRAAVPKLLRIELHEAPITWLEILGEICNFSSIADARLHLAGSVQLDVVEHMLVKMVLPENFSAWEPRPASATSCRILLDIFAVVSSGRTCQTNSVGCPDITHCGDKKRFSRNLASFMASFPRHSTGSRGGGNLSVSLPMGTQIPHIPCNNP